MTIPRKIRDLCPVVCLVGSGLVCLCCPGPAFAGSGFADSPVFQLDTADVSGVGDRPLPLVHQLGPCVPNPFNPSTWISFELASAAKVDLAIYDLRGRRVRDLSSGLAYPAGPNRVLWDGRDGAGRSVAAGIYIYRMRAGAYTASRRMTLLK